MVRGSQAPFGKTLNQEHLQPEKTLKTLTNPKSPPPVKNPTNAKTYKTNLKNLNFVSAIRPLLCPPAVHVCENKISDASAYFGARFKDHPLPSSRLGSSW
jgi:hypothetical protein